jgi:hypothetical protein
MRLLPSGGKSKLSACDARQGRRAATELYAGLDVGGKTTAICVADEAGKILWRGRLTPIRMQEREFALETTLQGASALSA